MPKWFFTLTKATCWQSLSALMPPCLWICSSTYPEFISISLTKIPYSICKELVQIISLLRIRFFVFFLTWHRIQGSRKLYWMKSLHKIKHILILWMSATNHNSTRGTCAFATKRNQRYFCITLQLLQIIQNIIYIHHYLKTRLIFMPTDNLCSSVS